MLHHLRTIANGFDQVATEVAGIGGDVADAFQLAELMLYDQEDLIHKANGWALRFAGDKDRKQLVKFLDQYAATMPRVTLRYALEHFDKKERELYLNKKKDG